MGWQYLVHGASVALVCSVPSFTDLGTSFADHPIRKLKSLQLLTCAVNPVYLRSSDQCWFGRRAVTEGRQHVKALTSLAVLSLSSPPQQPRAVGVAVPRSQPAGGLGKADRIRRIGIDPVCSESCLTVPPTLGEASGVSAAVLPSAVAPCSCKNLRPSRGSEEVTRRGLQDIFPVAAAGLCGRQGSKMSLHVHRTQRWAHLKFTAFLGLFPYASAQEQTLDYKILQPILVYLQSIV
ncbi:hypothetical protein Anapl_12992 [Anas platyrhynchos]|uniref:Uncharacterized protein n=1 Tax=Anas platyrhynchos TaxID=8839 RepID=R0L4U4_ANAPL|nr:hypothetical protein Anapl_12992 [Anas platyrhynchos]